MAIIDFFDRGWRINPEGAAYIQGGHRYSFDEVGRLSCRIARAADGRVRARQQGRDLGRQ